MDEKLSKALKAAKIHKEVRIMLRDYLKPNIKLYDICSTIENKVRDLTIEYGHGEQINGGVAFPTGVSLNNIAAHWTPNLGDQTILKKNDICKIDFGVHYDGWIIDSAFTVTFDDKYNNLLQASKEAVNAVIKNMSVDSRISELGEISEEIVDRIVSQIN